MDCKDLEPERNSSYRYTVKDFEATMFSLEEVRTLVEKSPAKPSVIRLGKKALHHNSSNVIQVMVGAGSFSRDLPRYLDVTMQLMKFERTEFNGALRLSYAEIQKARKADGQWIDLGSSTMFSPPQETVEKDFTALRKYKNQMLANKERFPDVVLFHGNSLSFFEINLWSGSYYFSSEAAESQSQKFFPYLKKYTELVDAYSPVSVRLFLYKNLRGDLQVDFQKSEQLILAAHTLKESIVNKPVQDVLFNGRRSQWAEEGDPVKLSFSSSHLLIEDVFDELGNPRDPKLISSCLEKQDYSQNFSVKCLGGPASVD